MGGYYRLALVGFFFAAFFATTLLRGFTLFAALVFPFAARFFPAPGVGGVALPGFFFAGFFGAVVLRFVVVLVEVVFFGLTVGFLLLEGVF